MYIETIKNLLGDEVAEVIEGMNPACEIEYNAVCHRIPGCVIRSGYNAVIKWREGVYRGINGNMDVFTPDGTLMGTIPVWTLHNMLSGETFTIRSIDSDDDTKFIRNVFDLAEYLGTTVDGIPDDVRKYHDYETSITLEDDGITLEVIAGDTGKKMSRQLLYPFSDDTYEDAHVGLQCWADATYWDAVHNGEV